MIHCTFFSSQLLHIKILRWNKKYQIIRKKHIKKVNRWHATCKMLRMIDNCCLVLCNYGVLDAFGRKMEKLDDMRWMIEWFLNIRCDCVIDIYHNIVIEERREDKIYIYIITCQKIINNSHNRMRVEMLLSQNEWLDFCFVKN